MNLQLNIKFVYASEHETKYLICVLSQRHKFGGEFLFAWNQTEFRFDVLSVPQIYCSQSLRQIYWATKPSYRKPSNTKVQQKIMDQKFSARNVCKNCCTAKWCFFETIFFLGIFSNCVQFLLSPSFWETLGKQRNSYHTKVFIFVQFFLYWEVILFLQMIYFP